MVRLGATSFGETACIILRDVKRFQDGRIVEDRAQALAVGGDDPIERQAARRRRWQGSLEIGLAGQQFLHAWQRISHWTTPFRISHY